MKSNILINKQTINKIYGYSAIELMGVLIVFSSLILFGNNYLSEQRQIRITNHLVDQSKSYSQQAIKYVTDNYRDLLQQSATDVVIPYSSLAAYASTGNMNRTNNFHVPCLYVTRGVNNTIRAYIIFGSINRNKSRKLNKQMIGDIAHGLGGNAGNLTNNNGNYLITGYTENEVSLSPATINNIINQCGFVSPLDPDNLIINLSKNIGLLAPIIGDIDKQSTILEADPSLKKSTTLGDNKLNTMQTNIYLDNIVKESTFKSVYYCDATKLPATDANTTCLNSAIAQGINMYGGTASWVNSIMDSTSQSCIATANAHFYSTTSGYTCTGVNFPNVSSFCPAKYNGQPQAPNTGYWSPLPGTLSGANCTSTATMKYQNNICMPISSTSLNFFRVDAKYSNGQLVGDNGYYNKCGYGRYISGSSATGVYNYSTNKCDYTIKCGAGGNQADAWTDNSNKGIVYGSPVARSCGQSSMRAKPTSQINDLGFKNC